MALVDSNVLGANTVFLGRVQSALLAACIAIFNEGTSVNLTQQALVTDAHINNAVSAMFNAFCAGIPA